MLNIDLICDFFLNDEMKLNFILAHVHFKEY